MMKVFADTNIFAEYTINDKDFRVSPDDTIRIMTPSQFVGLYN